MFHIEDGNPVLIANLNEGSVFGLISEALDRKQKKRLLLWMIVLYMN